MSAADDGYGQYCPIARALDVLGERWTLLIIRDLLTGTDRFNDLARGLPGLSRSLLSKRLHQLETAGLVEHAGGTYRLTKAGKDLEPIVFGLGAWGVRWLFGEPRPEECNSDLLVWWMHRRLDTAALPGRRVVIHVRFRDDRRLYWIVVDAAGPSMCTADPGFEVDVTISSDVSSLYQVWLGRLTIREALRARRLAFDGPSVLTRQMPAALRLSPMAAVVRQVG
jgi:DNA-binding HxlR family transcriptional regulator